MSKFKKVKEWTKENSDDIIVGAITIGTIVASVFLAKAAVKQAAEQEERYNKYMGYVHEQVRQGATVLPKDDGTYWIIPKS